MQHKGEMAVQAGVGSGAVPRREQMTAALAILLALGMAYGLVKLGDAIDAIGRDEWWKGEE
ncbi:hypothetical protein [Herbaspirillum sp. ST 5-3]|uniref:hypothetical protein n=1 Tax=Oxalobacteraceae TaxID=75682 RepID=UPI0010A3C153|nr:hypothetical protein [Herbaspirillum sp. ST 5-3]